VAFTKVEKVVRECIKKVNPFNNIDISFMIFNQIFYLVFIFLSERNNSFQFSIREGLIIFSLFFILNKFECRISNFFINIVCLH